MKKTGIIKYQRAVLKALAGKINKFYLSGGTALSLFYFQHRLSVDLDFFSPSFSALEVKRITDYLRTALGVEVKLIGQVAKRDLAKMMVYNVFFTNNNVLKIDFVEDVNELIKKPKIVDGIKILSLEDIYIRKLYALAGFVGESDETGRARFIGGRSDAKDFYDVYYLSHVFTPLSEFTNKYCGPTQIEGLVRWFQTFDRMEMMDGILSLETGKRTNYKDMEKHFKKEIDKLINKQIGNI